MPVPTDSPRIPRATARELVFERLREWIEDGTLAPGEVVKDAHIARQLGVSRTPVREALQLLEQLGVVETIPGRVTRVSRVAPDDAALLYPPLAALEATAARLATARATAEDIQVMAEANERLIDAATRGDPVGARQADEDFHGVLLRRAENPYLSSVTQSLQLHSRRLDTLYFSHLAPSRESYEEHKLIIDAIKQGDATRAEELTRRNFEKTIESLSQHTRDVSSAGDHGPPNLTGEQ